MSIPTQVNRDGRRDHSHHPGLDLRHLGSRSEHQNIGGEQPPAGGQQQQQQQQQQPPQQEFNCLVGQRNPVTGQLIGIPQPSGQGEADEEADDSDFEVVDHPIMTPPDSPANEGEAYATTSLLTERVPPELVNEILDHAEYFPHKIIAKKEETESVPNRDERTKVYLTAKIPDFKAFDEGTAGKGGAQGAGGRPGRVRRLVFRTSSRDQGWSSYSEHHGTYIGAWSWLDVELWRDVPEGGLKDDEGVTEGEGEHAKKVVKDGKYKVGTWLLQRNKHAVRQSTDHEIIWDWKEDELDDLAEEKWEEGETGGWFKGGKIRNGKFVRELKGGDEIRVTINCLYPGWRCTIEKCEIECFWAI